MRVDNQPNSNGTYALEALMLLDGAHDAHGGVMADMASGNAFKKIETPLWNGEQVGDDAAVDGFFMVYQHYSSDKEQTEELEKRTGDKKGIPYVEAIYKHDMELEVEVPNTNAKRVPVKPTVRIPTTIKDEKSFRDAASGRPVDWERKARTEETMETFEFKSVWKRAYEKYPDKLRDAFVHHGMHYNRMDPPLTEELKRSTMVKREREKKKGKLAVTFEDNAQTILAAALCDLAASQNVPEPYAKGEVCGVAKAAFDRNSSKSRSHNSYPELVPNERARSLRDFVEGQCVSWRYRGGDRSKSATVDKNVRVRVDHNGKKDSEAGFPESLIYLSSTKWKGDEFGDGFASELYTWTHFAALDTSGPKPRGSLMVRYVDWRDAYKKYPNLPVFKPDTCTDTCQWERYMQRLRQEKILTDTVLHPDSGGFDLDAFLRKMHNEGEWECCMPTWREDGQAGPSDFLYVILVCSHPKGKFGKVQIDAAKGLAKKMGVRRVVLSALGHVVPFYYVQGFVPVSRSGRSLKYVLQKPVGDTFLVPMNEKDDRKTIDIYNARLLTLGDFKDPNLKDANHPETPNPPVPYYAVYDAARYDKEIPPGLTFSPVNNPGKVDAVTLKRDQVQPWIPGPWPYEEEDKAARLRTIAVDALLALADQRFSLRVSPKAPL